MICTYNRVDDCLNTLAAMADDRGAGDVVESVVVVDQGTDPLDSRAAVRRVGERLGTRLRYLRQPNLGGAGGFTRGLFDATAGARRRPRRPAHGRRRPARARDPDPADGVRDLHDAPDARRRPDAEPAAPRAPAHQRRVRRARDAAGRAPGAGALQEAYLLGHDDRDLPTVQDQRIDTEYNGWWACLIPAEVVRAIGYPLPLFFQWDDIEYGYRARAHGFPTVALPGPASGTPTSGGRTGTSGTGTSTCATG